MMPPTTDTQDETPSQPDAWGRDPDDKTPHRVDILRRRVATCPACHLGIYADVGVRTEVHAPRIDDGTAKPSATARTIGASVSHECAGTRRDEVSFAAVLAKFFDRPAGDA